MGPDHKTVHIEALMSFLQNRPVYFHEIWCAYKHPIGASTSVYIYGIRAVLSLRSERFVSPDLFPVQMCRKLFSDSTKPWTIICSQLF